jgi:hypothetical protein
MVALLDGPGHRHVGWQPSRFLTDRAEAERAFALAEQLGSVNAAGAEVSVPAILRTASSSGPTRSVCLEGLVQVRWSRRNPRTCLAKASGMRSIAMCC